MKNKIKNQDINYLCNINADNIKYIQEKHSHTNFKL